MRIIIDDQAETTEPACWPCWQWVALSGEVRVERDGAHLVVRVSPSHAVSAGA